MSAIVTPSDDIGGTADLARTSSDPTTTTLGDLEIVYTDHRSRAIRTLDLVLGGTLLLVAMPLMGAIAVAVWADDRGPIFYRQLRSGQGGRPFKIVKFRTMVVDADERLTQLLKTDDGLSAEYAAAAKLKRDPRVSRIGRFLRPTGLDELPQLLNVVRGEMSLVGPRPLALTEERKYGHFAGLVWTVKPGMTGAWQISGRNDTTYDERVAIDVEYVRRKSPRSDLSILVRTCGQLLSGRLRGGY